MSVSSKIDSNQSTIRFRYGSIGALLIAVCVMIPIGIWNRYIFLESNLPLLLFFLIIAAFVFRANRIYWRGMLFFSISFLSLIVYAWSRLDNVWAFQLSLSGMSNMVEEGKSGFSYVLDLIIFYFLFVITALLYYKKANLPAFLWFLICGYVIAFILRNSLDIAGLQEGYNLGPGPVLVTLLPFIYLKNSEKEGGSLFVANAMVILCVSWLALIGARTAVAALLLFYAAMRAWPLIIRNRFIYYATFFGLLLMMVTLTILYLTVQYLDVAVLEDTGFNIFSKRLGTRTDIWVHLLYEISQNPMYGYGTDHATAALSPLPFLEFTMTRDNIGAHSTFFEILYRLGIFGLLSFLLIMFGIWRLFWNGRTQWTVRVAGSFLLSTLFFASTSAFMVFSTLQLRSGFAWIVLGTGAGASLRAMISVRQRYQPRCQRKQLTGVAILNE